MKGLMWFLFLVALCFHPLVLGTTDPSDFAILDEFRKGLKNPELLKWPSDGEDPCGPPHWPHVFCSGSRVTQIQVQELGLKGPLPQNLNQMPMLTNLGLQRNQFSGPLPSFAGLSGLQFAYLGGNQFDTIPSDFFVGLTNLQVLSLEHNPLNKSTGWSLPRELENSAPLTNLSLMNCSLVGPMPDFLGGMASLKVLELSYNNLSGEIPASYSGSAMEILWLNNQAGTGLSGPIDAIASMVSLKDAWLHGNSFSGSIPAAIGGCTSLARLWLNSNRLVGLVPESLTTLPQLQSLKLENNMLMGPKPKVGFKDFSCNPNSFCQSTAGIPCSPEVTALLDFLSSVDYPTGLAASWSGNNPCSNWIGVSCSAGKVSVINLPHYNLSGSISPSIGKLDSLADIRLNGNNLSGVIPGSLAKMSLLRMLNVSANNLQPPIPKFSSSVTLLTDGNPLLKVSDPPAPPPDNHPPSEEPPSPSLPGNNSSSPQLPLSPSESPNSGNSTSITGKNPPSGKSPNSAGTTPNGSTKPPSKGPRRSKSLIIMIPIVLGVSLVLLIILLLCCQRHRKSGGFMTPGSVVVHPKDGANADDMIKTVIAENSDNSLTLSEVQSQSTGATGEAHTMEAGTFVVSVQILRSLTKNFAAENELGRGGFGVVYKGELHDGTVIAVKRMEAAMVSNKACDEFQAEIDVLSKVRHRNLVSLLGYSVEGNERLLVYEYMPQGALSQHLFQWKQLNLEPLSWKKRLNIALDVARGMEYLHNLTHQCFIHRDLKSSNILLGDDYRAKISDFGLVKLAPDGKNSVTTRLAGTFGYLAPEYAVTGKITTKADVYSFGVVLMELVTGLTALDENRTEESRYLASWFIDIRSNEESLKAAIDSSLDKSEETFESISIIAELAGHCTAREPHQRPNMGHAVNVLAPMVEKWKPVDDDQEDCLGIDLQQPLLQMVKGWQVADDMSSSSSTKLDDSKGSIPARPAGFAESFTSADGR